MSWILCLLMNKSYMTKDYSPSQLAATIKWWLNYTSSVGRDYILSEGAIKFPLVEYLERSNVEHIELEYSHPDFSKKRFDLFFIEKITRLEYVYEFKYIKNASTKDRDEKQRIFDDLMRLFVYVNSSRKGNFLICGEQAEFVANFQRIQKYQGAIRTRQASSLPTKFTSEGFYTEWFSFEPSSPVKEINLQTQNSEYREIYDQFKSDYSSCYLRKTGNQLRLPNSIQTKLLYLSDQIAGEDTIYQPSRIGIWEVIK